MNLEDLEGRASSREVLRAGYWADVELLAQEMETRIRRGEFDKNYPWFGEILDEAVRRHARVRDLNSAIETIAYSDNRSAIQEDFDEASTKKKDGPWTSFVVPIDEEAGEPCFITLPPWEAIAYYAFHRDVWSRIYGLLGDYPEQYIAARMGDAWG